MSRIIVEFDSVNTDVGRADVTDWDFSYGDEKIVRVTLDGMFRYEFKLPQDYLTSTFMIVSLDLIWSEVGESLYDRLYLDQFDCDYIRRMLVENNCVGDM